MNATRSHFFIGIQGYRNSTRLRYLRFSFAYFCTSAATISHAKGASKSKNKMGKNKKNTAPAEENLDLPSHPFYSQASDSRDSATTFTSIVDTHTHLVSTFNSYVSAYPQHRFQTIHEFVRGYYTSGQPSKVEAIVDVWCEAPVLKVWKELADSALTEESRRELWGGIEYWFVIGKWKLPSIKCHWDC